MGPTAKAGLLCSMLALMFAGQLLEREMAARRRAAVEEKKKAPAPYAERIKPLAIGELPRPRPEAPPSGATAGAAASGSSSAAPAGAASGARAGPLRTAPDGSTTYVVQQGDTLARIAKKLYGTEGALDLIAERNRRTLPDPAKLQVGMTLHIPSRERVAPR